MQACCTGAQGSEEERLKQEYLESLRAAGGGGHHAAALGQPNTKASDLNDAISGLGSDASSKSGTFTPRRMSKKANNNEDESGGAGSSNKKNRSMNSQKGGQFSQAIRQHTQMSEGLSSNSRGPPSSREGK